VGDVGDVIYRGSIERLIVARVFARGAGAGGVESAGGGGDPRMVCEEGVLVNEPDRDGGLGLKGKRKTLS
jgi:hypothetical protein